MFTRSQVAGPMFTDVLSLLPTEITVKGTGHTGLRF